MFIRKIVVSAIFLGAFLICGDAKSQFYNSLRCDTCTTSQDFKARALAAGQGHHLVYNLATNQAEYWHVVVNRPGPGGPGGSENPRFAGMTSGAEAHSRSLPVAAAEELDKAHQLHVIGGGTLRPIINVPISYLDLYESTARKTAYDFVGDFNMQRMVESAAGDPAVISEVTSTDLLTALADLQGLATSVLGLKGQADLLFRIVMTDGSSVDIRIRLDHPNGEYLADSARTAGGQAIPSHLHEVSGEWANENGDDLGPMIHHFGRLGATLHYLGPSTGVARSVVCSGSGAAKVCEVKLILR